MTRKNKIGLAVAAALSIGAVAQSTQAANLAPSGVGELLYIPYYSTKDGKQSYIRIVNNGFDTLAVKLKIREGTDSADARDFHIFLSPRDIWSGRVFTDSTGGVRLHTNDTSCTVPDKARGWATGTPSDPAGSGWSINVPAVGNTASTEGYIVAQVMGASKLNPFDNDVDVASLVKHIDRPDGFIGPRDCFSVSAAFDLTTTDLTIKNPAAYDSVRSQFTEPTNALSGAAAIVNPVNSTLTDLPVTVVANVYNPGPTGVDDTTGTAEAGPNDFPNDTIFVVASDFPDERTATPVATIFDDNSASAVTLGNLTTDVPVSAALMHSSVMNNLDTTGANSWVVTFPTKRLHLAVPCTAPFPATCVPEVTPLQHTVLNQGPISYVTNEEESAFATPEANQICFSGPDFLENCQQTVNGIIPLPTEVNVVTFNGGNPLNSELTSDVSGDFLGDIVFGWMQMRYSNAVPLTGTNVVSGAATNLFGLPVIGFAYTQYNINGITTTMSQAHTFSSPLTP